jgi:hypothetical protein
MRLFFVTENHNKTENEILLLISIVFYTIEISSVILETNGKNKQEFSDLSTDLSKFTIEAILFLQLEEA